MEGGAAAKLAAYRVEGNGKLRLSEDGFVWDGSPAVFERQLAGFIGFIILAGYELVRGALLGHAASRTGKAQHALLLPAAMSALPAGLILGSLLFLMQLKGARAWRALVVFMVVLSPVVGIVSFTILGEGGEVGD